MRRYLITGSSGFVGYHFLKYLNAQVDEKIDVLGIDIIKPSDFNLEDFDNININFLVVNLLDKLALTKIIEEFNPSHILHLAALSSVGKSWQNPSECFTNNTGIFLNIVEILRIKNINAKLLCIGSSEEYGYVGEKDIPISEALDIKPQSPYAVTKVAQEGLSRCYVEKFGMNITLTRSFNHIGTRQKDTFVIASFCKQVAQAYLDGDKTLLLTTGNLDVIRDFLDVRDVVSAYYLILEKGKAGELYNVCSSKGYQLREIIRKLEKISKISITTKTDPALIRPNDMPRIIGDNSKLIHDTGWNLVYDIDQSLKDIFDYWVKKLSKME